MRGDGTVDTSRSTPGSTRPVATSTSTTPTPAIESETVGPRRTPQRFSTNKSSMGPSTSQSKNPPPPPSAAGGGGSTNNSKGRDSGTSVPKGARKAAQFALIDAAKKGLGGKNSNSSNKSSHAKTKSIDESAAAVTGEGDDGDWSTQSFPNYAQLVYTMLEETHNKDPEIMRWTDDGLAFSVNLDHPKLVSVLQKYFDRKLAPPCVHFVVAKRL
jgi:hypothetical protein